MLFTQFNMEDALEVRYEEGIEEGEERGRVLMLVEQVRRKLQKGKTAETISEELDEPMETIEKICAAVRQCGEDADASTIYEVLQ